MNQIPLAAISQGDLTTVLIVVAIICGVVYIWRNARK